MVNEEELGRSMPWPAAAAAGGRGELRVVRRLAFLETCTARLKGLF